MVIVRSLVVTMGAAALSFAASAAIVTNDTLVITAPTSWSGVTNLYANKTFPGSVCADLTIDKRSYVRCIGHDSKNQPSVKPQFYFATNANDVTLWVKGRSGFYLGYRGAKSPAAWAAVGIDDPNRTNDNEMRPWIETHVGVDGEPGSTGRFQIKLENSADFGNVADSPFWAEWLYVERSVSTNAPGVIDLVTIPSSVNLDISHLENRNAHPVRVKFAGGWLRRNNANSVDATLAPASGSELILEGDGVYPVRYHKQYNEVKFTARLGGTVRVRGKNVELRSNGPGADFRYWDLNSTDNVSWEHTGKLSLKNNTWIHTSSPDVLPHAATQEGIEIGANLNPGAGKFSHSCIDLYGTTQHVNSVTSENQDGFIGIITNTHATATGVIALGEHNQNCTFNAHCRARVTVLKEGVGLLTAQNAAGERLEALGGAVAFTGSSAFGVVTAAEGVELSGALSVNDELALAGSGEIYLPGFTPALASSARISLESGAVLSVRSLTVDGATVAAAAYTSAPWLNGGTVVVLDDGSAPAALTWTAGAGGDTSAATAANWGLDAAPSFAALGHLPTFASAGGTATFAQGRYNFSGLGFAAPGDFTLAGADAAYSLFGGISLGAVAPGESRLYTVEGPVTLYGESTLTMVSNVTLRLAGGLDGVKGSKLTLQGEKLSAGAYDYSTNGMLVIENGRFPGVMEHKLGGGWLVLRGDFGVPDDTNPLYLHYGRFRASGGASNDGSGWLEGGLTRFENCTCYKPLDLAGVGMVSGATGVYTWLVSAPGTTNVLKGQVTHHASVAYCLGGNSTTILEGGHVDALMSNAGSGMVSLNTDVSASSSAPARFIVKKPFVLQDVRGMSFSGQGSSIILEFDCTGNRIPLLSSTWIVKKLVFDVDDAIEPTVWRAYNVMYVDLNGTRQRILDFENQEHRADIYNSSRSFSSTTPAEIVVTRGSLDPEASRDDSRMNTSCVEARFIGPVKLTMAGEGLLYFKSYAFESTGDFEVNNGTAEFSAGASWLGGTNVIVKGSGRLVTKAAGVFDGSKAQFHLGADSDGWFIDLPSGTTQRAVWAYDGDGKPLPGGVYGNSATPGVTQTRYSSHFPANGGTLRVVRHAATIILR